jgi:uncharacterized protein (DUF1800 family)
MTRTRARAFPILLAAVALTGSIDLSAAPGSTEAPPLTAREKALHALNRLGFGPRPGDVDRVLAMGVDAWIVQQLNPESIPDRLVAAKVKDLSTLSMSRAELFDTFERPLREALQERKRELAEKDGAAAGADTAAIDFEKLKERIPPEKRPRRIIEELAAARVLRAAYSERQLNEVMVDFWMNHFNVYAAKGLDRVFMTSFEQDAIRPHIWGRFEDLLMATAKSPAMLFYLDNAQSAAAEDQRPPRPMRGSLRRVLFANEDETAAPKKKRASGLNENYARELMELHTLGVDGGYNQKDITELARVLTGWSIDRRGGEPGGFLFRPRVHDIAAKTVLGHLFPPGGGIEEGEMMIQILAHHPATARHIARQLVERLVADDPPQELVERVARKFLATDGDLRQTVRAIVESTEFYDPRYYRAKVKSPFEYAVSAVRAAGGQTDGALPVLKAIAQMGEPLYLCQPPTGYSDASAAWVNTGALMARLNFALALAANKIPGTEMDVERLVDRQDAGDPKKSVGALARALAGGELSDETRETIEKRLQSIPAPSTDPSANTQLPLVAGLILGSPEFQRQ